MFETEVQAGIAVLTDKGIDWRTAAQSSFLDMSRVDTCILGLTTGSYWSVMRNWDVTEQWMEAHGFLISDETFETMDVDYHDTYRELAAAWRNAATAELVAV